MLKVVGWVVGGEWVARSILVSAPVPFGLRSYWDLVGVMGLRVWGQGLTIFVSCLNLSRSFSPILVTPLEFSQEFNYGDIILM